MSAETERRITAVVLERPGARASVEEVILTTPGPGQVLVRMDASGVCHSDLHLADGEWTADTAVVLGHEGCGVIEEVGRGVDADLIGRRVVLDWLSPCMQCAACISGQAWNCRRTRALENRLADGGSRLQRGDGSTLMPYLGLGTLAESVVVDAKTAVPIPHEVDPVAGALIGCCVSTGVGAVLKTADVPAGSTVVVYGLGGVGLSIIMGAVLAGATTIVAVDRHLAKLAIASSVGATAGIVAEDPERTVQAVGDATGGGADFAFEAIGLSTTIEQTIRSVRAGGTAVLVGMTPLGVRASFDGFDLVDRSLRILGSNYGFTVGPIDFPRYAGL
ncbi:MAG TPA: alcohol dehydrogenase catalytic domain-containing protein, partial [Candidatus Limnocylindrales bacterium]|nr:alcohol dehydrogenase catalytic domain-containing protein [Candidatus Limnocylindrales bacterium]